MWTYKASRSAILLHKLYPAQKQQQYCHARCSHFHFFKKNETIQQRQACEDNAGVRALRGGGALLYGGTDCGVRLFFLSYYFQLKLLIASDAGSRCSGPDTTLDDILQDFLRRYIEYYGECLICHTNDLSNRQRVILNMQNVSPLAGEGAAELTADAVDIRNSKSAPFTRTPSQQRQRAPVHILRASRISPCCIPFAQISHSCPSCAPQQMLSTSSIS